MRPNIEYIAGHISRAISISWNELAQRLDELPLNQDVVAYCRGLYCVYADEALAILRQNGRHGLRLEKGALEWQLAMNSE